MLTRLDPTLESNTVIDTWHVHAKTDAILRVDVVIRFIRDTPPR